MAKKKSKNFFKVAHSFEEEYGYQLSISAKYFFIVLLKLENRFGDTNDSFWHTDKKFTTAKGIIGGFEIYGFSLSTCKRARKKLRDLDLIITKPGWYKNGNRSGTYYQINHNVLNDRVQKEPPATQ